MVVSFYNYEALTFLDIFDTFSKNIAKECQPLESTYLLLPDDRITSTGLNCTQNITVKPLLARDGSLYRLLRKFPRKT